VRIFTFKLQPQCRIKLLKEAWRTSLENLEILRTSIHFSVELDRWTRVAHPALEFKWSTVERESIDNAAKEFLSGLDFVGEDPLHHPPIPPPVTYLLNYLVVALHHVFYDGVSLPTLRLC